MKQLITIGALLAVSAATWHIGARMSREEFNLVFGLLLGVGVVGLPTAVIIITTTAQRARLDVYHHTAAETPREPVQQPTAAITARPAMIAQRFVVVGEREQLRAVISKRIEVSK